MRNAKINQRGYIALNYLGEVEAVDSKGYSTGETEIAYSDEIPFKAHLSGAMGTTYIDSNGVSIEYDKSLVLTLWEFKKLGFDENTVFFIDKKPEYDAQQLPLYDYRVERKRETLNEVVLLLKKVRNK